MYPPVEQLTSQFSAIDDDAFMSLMSRFENPTSVVLPTPLNSSQLNQVNMEGVVPKMPIINKRKTKRAWKKSDVCLESV